MSHPVTTTKPLVLLEFLAEADPTPAQYELLARLFRQLGDPDKAREMEAAAGPVTTGAIKRPPRDHP